MNYAATDDKVCIGTLRVKGADENVTLRLKLSSWFSRAELRPIGIPPSAVLVVKRLVDPQPERLDLFQHSIRIDNSWERAVQTKLYEAYRHAARPLYGSVPANSEAIVFSDEAEMLACLTQDLIRNEASGHWWWHTFLRSMPYSTTDNVTRLLCDRPTLVPAILHHLAERRQVETVVAGLSPEQALRILATMNRAYALPDLPQGMHDWPSPIPAESEAVNDILPSGNIHFDKEKTRQERASVFTSPTTSHRRDAEMPWDHWLPSGFVPTHWPREKACLLGVGLTLYSAPAAVRSGTFLQKLHQWWVAPAPALSAEESSPTSPVLFRQQRLADEPAVKPDSPKDLIEPLSQEAPKTAQAGAVEATAAMATPSSVTGSASAQNTQTHPAEPQAKPLPTEASTPLPEAPELRMVDGSSAESAILPLIKSDTPETSLREPELFDAESQAGSAENPLLFENGVATQLGGALYLINLMAQLDLPQCFEEEWGLASRLGAWGVLDILARALLDEPDESLCHDPLWQALAELDSRSPCELPGADFQGSGTFHLPLVWPGYVGDDANGAYAWSTDGHRYCLWSEQGYVLAEDLRGDPLAALSRYFKEAPVNLSEQPCNNAPIAKLNNPLLAGINSDLSRWLALVLPYLRLRLQLALRTTMDLKALLLQSGRLYLTSTHIDLVLSLNRVSIPVRIAGLDLDPGWAPDFGRVVLFHYE